VEPLRELAAAGEKRGAGECVYVVAGELTEQARRLAEEKRVRLMDGASLLALARR
jgi:restriction system protein